MNLYILVFLTLILVIFIYEAFVHDKHSIDKLPHCKTNEERAKYKKSKVKKMLIQLRDSVIRGFLVGIATGSVTGAFNNVLLWGLTGGVTSGIVDMFGWTDSFPV